MQKHKRDFFSNFNHRNCQTAGMLRGPPISFLSGHGDSLAMFILTFSGSPHLPAILPARGLHREMVEQMRFKTCMLNWL